MKRSAGEWKATIGREQVSRLALMLPLLAALCLACGSTAPRPTPFPTSIVAPASTGTAGPRVLLPSATVTSAAASQTAPANAAGGTYTVRAGDTLSLIAQRLGVTTDALIAANPGLNPSVIQ